MSVLLDQLLTSQQRAQANAADMALFGTINHAAASALGHYRNVQAMASAQATYDDMQPPAYFDDDMLPMDPHDARDLATAEVLATAEPAADAIAKLCAVPEGASPIDPANLTDVDVIDGTACQCLAVILGGTNASAVLTAARRLAELVAKAQADVINERAAQLVRGS